MTRVEFDEKMLRKFEDDRSNAGRYWKGFRLKRQQSEVESSFAANGITSEVLEDAIN